MVDIKTEQVNGRTHASPVRGFFGQAAEVTGDLIELTELQVQLAKADAADAIRMAVRPITVIAVSGVVLLALLPILFFAISGFVARYSGVSSELAQLIVSMLAVAIATIATMIAARYLGAAAQPFSRSAAEFKHNVDWLKTIFRSSHSK